MKDLMNAAGRAVGSLLIPGMLGIFVLSLILAFLILMAFVGLGVMVFTWWAEPYGLAGFAPWLGSIGAGWFALLLFPSITPIIVSFFDVSITRLIEQHDYPATQQPKPLPFWPEFWHDVRFALKALLLNIIVLPLYLIPGVNVVLFYLLNGSLLGREYFVMAARRHMSVVQAVALRKQHAREVLGGGILITLLATIPVANLFAPFWGVAVMVHLYHLVSGTPPSTLLHTRK